MNDPFDVEEWLSRVLAAAQTLAELHQEAKQASQERGHDQETVRLVRKYILEEITTQIKISEEVHDDDV